MVESRWLTATVHITGSVAVEQTFGREQSDTGWTLEPNFKLQGAGVVEVGNNTGYDTNVQTRDTNVQTYNINVRR